MIRYTFALVLFAMIACLAFQSESASVLAQAKKDKTKKNQEAPPPEGEVKEDLSRVLPVFDPGSHTQPISAMGFTKDKSKLITVGQDFTVQVWSTSSGERLDVLRLPGYGREKGYDAGRWDVAAVSADGTRVAIGGEPKFLNDLSENNGARLVVIDVVKRTVARVMVRTGRNRPVTALAFSPDGDTLAVSIETGPKENPVLLVVGDLANRITNAKPVIQTLDRQHVSLGNSPTILTFSPDGTKLLVAGKTGPVQIWDVPAGAAPQPKKAKDLTVVGFTTSLAWSPDGTQFVRGWKGGDTNAEAKDRGIETRDLDEKSLKSWHFDDLTPALDRGRAGTIHSTHFLDLQTLYFVANATTDGQLGNGSIAGVLDMNTGKSRRLAAFPEAMVTDSVGTQSSDGQLIALSVTGNTEVMIGSAKGNTPLVRCGQRTPVPFYVGWAKDPAKPGFAWANTRETRKGKERNPELLRFGFDLLNAEPIGEIRGSDYETARSKIGEWSFEAVGKGKKQDDGFIGPLRLMQGEKAVAGFRIGERSPHTLIPRGDKPPLIAIRHGVKAHDQACIYKSDGTIQTQLLPNLPCVTDVASSPDGRFLIYATGTPRLVVYPTDGSSSYPLFSFAQLNGEWVLWTPEGYYDASPGGEKMFGWAINNGPNELVTFHPAVKFAKQYRRPDIIKLAIEKGSIKEALAILKTAPPEPEAILPPTATLTLVKQEGSKVQVKAVANSADKTRPVKSIQLLLKGLPLAEGNGRLVVPEGKPAEAVWDVVIPGGRHELTLFAETYDNAAQSEPLIVVAPRIPGQQPTLYRVCVGINDYDEEGLRLKAATKDATEVFKAFEDYCTGPYNRFGAAKGELLLDKQATREAVLKSLNEVRKAAKQGDLFVLFFAGHGHKQDSDFYLSTREADTNKSLKGISLSEEDLRNSLSGWDCPVLLILDACHSAKAVKAFRPATDDLTRSLTDDSVKVTVLGAAMAHEVAKASEENGFFTAGLLKALKAESGVPFDSYQRVLNTIHLWSVIHEEVIKASNGKQTPFLNQPWTVPPLVVREVAK